MVQLFSAVAGRAESESEGVESVEIVGGMPVPDKIGV